MSENENHHPGTVSKILWHFTGGPKWNIVKNTQHKQPKPAKEAYQNIISIIESMTLRLGQYSEVLEVNGPDVFIPKEQKEIKLKTHIVSSPVCCLADVPIMHLEYIAKRYGKFAIGFRRDSVINRGFNPVLYTLNDTPVITNIVNSLNQLRTDEEYRFDPINEIINDLNEMKAKNILNDNYRRFEDDVEKLRNRFREAYKGIVHLLAYVKIFKENEFHTIY